MCPSSPKRQITAIVRVDASTIARLEVETAVLFAIYQRALNDWLDSLDRLKEAEQNAQNAEELVDVVTRAERLTA